VTAARNDIILEAVALEKRFAGRRGGLFTPPPTVRAVDGVSLRIRRGETLALVGESGSGKSTLGRLMLDLMPPTSGDVLYEGRNTGALSAAEKRALRRELGIVFQDPFASLNPRMRVAEIVGEPIWLHEGLSRADRSAKAADLLRTVGLRPEHGDRYPHEFSGGQRQRIGIARALASSPTLLLGDEPVSALDVSVQAQIVNLLEDLKSRFGLTLLVVAHGLGVIRHMSDRVAVMYLGQIVELAPVDALFENPLHPYSQALLASVPVPDPKVRRARVLLEGDIPSATRPPPGCRFHTRCPHARPLCREARPTLEEVSGSGEPRSVACHFWSEIAGAAGAGAIAPPPSAALARRLALFEAGSRTVTAEPG
jgi:oligopeptide/dipeptide ABC transporter ATP-binding protein